MFSKSAHPTASCSRSAGAPGVPPLSCGVSSAGELRACLAIRVGTFTRAASAGRSLQAGDGMVELETLRSRRQGPSVYWNRSPGQHGNRRPCSSCQVLRSVEYLLHHPTVEVVDEEREAGRCRCAGASPACATALASRRCIATAYWPQRPPLTRAGSLPVDTWRRTPDRGSAKYSADENPARPARRRAGRRSSCR